MGPSLTNMRKGSYLAILVIIITLAACGGKRNTSWVYYNETQCADKWEQTNNNEKLKDNITSHFKSKGIRIYEIEIFNDAPAAACMACNCSSGRVIKCKVKNQDVEKMKAEGFHQ